MNTPTNPVLHVPAHKQTNPAAKPGQIVNHYDEFEEIVVLQGRTDAVTAAAADMFGVAPSEVTPEQRKYAKTVGFAKMYGASSSLGTLPALAAKPGQIVTHVARAPGDTGKAARKLTQDDKLTLKMLGLNRSGHQL